MWHLELRSCGQVHANAPAVIPLLNLAYQFLLPITSAETAAQALHALPSHYAAMYVGFPLMHISRQLTGVLPPHVQVAKRTDTVRVLVAIACEMPLRGNLRCLDSQGVARTDHLPKTIGAAAPLAAGIASPTTYRGCPFMGMSASGRGILPVTAHPHRLDLAATGHLVKVDVRILCGVHLRNQLRVFIFQ